MAIKHPFTSPIADEGDPNEVGPNEWNADHTLENDTVTYAKIQNVTAASKLLGRGSAAGAGDVEEIGLGDAVSMSGTTLTVADGSVTRAKLQNSAASTLLGRGSAAGAGAPQEISVGAGLSMSGTALIATGAPAANITIEEQDASPSVAAVTKIKVTNGTLTDEGGGIVSISTGGTGAPADATYVTLTANATLSAEAVLGSAVIMLGVIAARPASATAGLLYFATDEGKLYRDNGATWDLIGISSSFTGDLSGVVTKIKTSTGPTTLTVGAVADGEFLKRSGTDIIGGVASAGAANISTQLFTASDTYTKPAGLLFAQVIVIGGGGGGGGADNANNYGGGGGGGGTAIRWLMAASIGATETVTVGTGGAGGANTGGNGGNGNNSSFGTLAVGNGGAGGTGDSATDDSKAGGAGGTATSGTINLTGQDGGYSAGVASIGYGGPGGNSGGGYGMGGAINGGGFLLDRNGFAGKSYGGGGSGGVSGSVAGATGGAGANGAVLVIEYKT